VGSEHRPIQLAANIGRSIEHFFVLQHILAQLVKNIDFLVCVESVVSDAILAKLSYGHTAYNGVHISKCIIQFSHSEVLVVDS